MIHHTNHTHVTRFILYHCSKVMVSFTHFRQVYFTGTGTWWRHHMGTFSASLALCTGNSPFTDEFPWQSPVTRSFDVFYDLRLNKRSNAQSIRWWFEMPSHWLWRHCSGESFDIASASDKYRYIHHAGSLSIMIHLSVAITTQHNITRTLCVHDSWGVFYINRPRRWMIMKNLQNWIEEYSSARWYGFRCVYVHCCVCVKSKLWNGICWKWHLYAHSLPLRQLSRHPKLWGRFRRKDVRNVS